MLARNKGQVFSKEQIYDQDWGDSYFSDSRNIIAYINKIRKKIEPDPANPIYILTVWGIGYKFNEKIEQAECVRKGIKYAITAYFNIGITALERGEKMKNEITEKLELFFQNLRCDDAKRETLVHLDSCRIESERLVGMEEEHRQVMNRLDQQSKAILENYTEQILSKAFAEQQEAYLQGILDAFQILSGLGILPLNQNVEKIIAHLKNDSPE